MPLTYAGAAGAVLQTGQRIGTSVGLAVILAVTFAVKDAFNWEVGAAAGFLTISTAFFATLLVAVADDRGDTKAVNLSRIAEPPH